MSATPLRVGIDLGTTFSCLAALDERGRPVVVPDASGPTTPSVLWFDGREAIVGDCAYLREAEAPGHLFSFVKRQTGRPHALPDDPPPGAEAFPGQAGGYDWGVVGIQAVFLRKLRHDAVAHFREVGRLGSDTADAEAAIEAVVTVPAYFKDVQRQQTRQAAEAAGFVVLGLINEPTAAALTHRVVTSGTRRVFVFDLGGGTFDVTVAEIQAGRRRNGGTRVLATGGSDTLGGKDWDALIAAHLRTCYVEAHDGAAFPREHEVALAQIATSAKVALTTDPEVEVTLPFGPRSVSTTLFRRSPADPADREPGAFYFESRARELLARVRASCTQVIRDVAIESAGRRRPLEWGDIDEVLLVGGSSRMPMVRDLVEELAGRPAYWDESQGELDLSVARGAALFARREARVADVSSSTYGVKVRREDEGYTFDVVDPLIRRNEPIPADPVERTFEAAADALFELYQGESDDPRLCDFRGALQLENPEGPVDVRLAMDRDGTLRASVRYDGPDGPANHDLEILNPLFGDDRHAELVRRVRAVEVRDCRGWAGADGDGERGDRAVEGSGRRLGAEVSRRVADARRAIGQGLVPPDRLREMSQWAGDWIPDPADVVDRVGEAVESAASRLRAASRFPDRDA